MTYTLIAHQELGSAQANITFSSIPATFTDLLIVHSIRSANASVLGVVRAEFNGSSSNLSYRELFGDGSGAASSAASVSRAGYASGNNATSSTFGNSSIYIPNYRSSVAKSFSVDGVSETNGTSAFQVIAANLWNDTAAITSIRLFIDGGSNIMQYSSATLYGITSGSSGGVVVS
jgi:hypothetical protein